MLVVAYQFNGALSVGELLGSTTLFRAAVRVLALARGKEAPTAVTPPSEEEEMLADLQSRTTSLA